MRARAEDHPLEKSTRLGCGRPAYNQARLATRKGLSITPYGEITAKANETILRVGVPDTGLPLVRLASASDRQGTIDFALAKQNGMYEERKINVRAGFLSRDQRLRLEPAMLEINPHNSWKIQPPCPSFLPEMLQM